MLIVLFRAACTVHVQITATLLHSTYAADTWESCMLITPLINTCHSETVSIENIAQYITVHDTNNGVKQLTPVIKPVTG